MMQREDAAPPIRPDSRTLATFQVYLLGPFRLERDGMLIETGRWQRRVASLFKLLVTAPDQRRLRDEVIDLLWPDADPATGAANLRVATHRLRVALGGAPHPPVRPEQGWIALNQTFRWNTDIHEVEQVTRSGVTEITALEHALMLYRGEPLIDERYEEWAVSIRLRLERTWRELALRLVEAYCERSLSSDAIRWLRRMVEHDPLDEEAVHLLVELLIQVGARADAVRQYQELERQLRSELGAAPSTRTRSLIEDVRTPPGQTGGPAVSGSSGSWLPVGSFLGALPEGQMVAREQELERILFAAERAAEGHGRLVVLAGEGGVGKTRLAQEVALELRNRGFVVGTGRCGDHRAQALPPLLSEVIDTLRRDVSSERWTQAATGHAEGDGSAGSRAAVEPETIEPEHLSRLAPRVVLALAEAGPTAVLLDDLQCADAVTLRFLHDLARSLGHSRLLLLGTYREEATVADHGLARVTHELAREGLLERVTLLPLGLDGTAALVHAMVGPMEGSEEFVTFVHRRTKGNPFYIDRMVQAVAGRYALIRQIGAGGMGRVFEAVDCHAGEPVAVKLMFARTEADPRALHRFEKEGAALALLSHPNIVRVYGTFLGELTNAIVMELLDGVSLRQLMSNARAPLPLPRIQHLAAQVADALACAHQHGIIHRDIKPENVMVLSDDRVKVTDFGIARLTRPRGDFTTLASTGMIMGTPHYMAPEQITGRQVDGRADIYALGVMLYRLVTGQVPFDGGDPLTIAFRHVHEAPVAPGQITPDVPEDWEAVILTAMAKDPAERFQTAAEMTTAIAQLGRVGGVASHSRVSVPRDGSTESPRHGQAAAGQRGTTLRPRRTLGLGRRWRTGAAAAASLILLVTGTFVLGDRLGARSTGGSLTTPANTTRLLQLNEPGDIAVDPHGNVWIADTRNNRLLELTPDGMLLRTVGTYGSGVGHFNFPDSLGVTSNSTIMVDDRGNSRIEMLTPSGYERDELPNTAGSIAVDPADDLYVADLPHHQVWEYSRMLDLLGHWRVPEVRVQNGLYPAGVAIAVDGHRHLYVADYANKRVLELEPRGSVMVAVRVIGTGRSGYPYAFHPHGVALGRVGNIYVADTANSRIVKFSPQGKLLATWTSPGGRRGHFHLPGTPSKLAVDAQENVYVTDLPLDRVEKFSPNGKALWETNGRRLIIVSR